MFRFLFIYRVVSHSKSTSVSMTFSEFAKTDVEMSFRALFRCRYLFFVSKLVSKNDFRLNSNDLASLNRIDLALSFTSKLKPVVTIEY